MVKVTEEMRRIIVALKGSMRVENEEVIKCRKR